MLKISELPPPLTTGVTQHDLVKGQILFQQGEAAQAIYWVKSGRVKLISFTEQQMITAKVLQKQPCILIPLPAPRSPNNLRR